MRLLPRQQPWRGFAICAWLGLAVGSLALTVAAIHQIRGVDLIRRTQRRHAAAGIGGTLHDALAAAPKVDAARQQRWWELHLRVQLHSAQFRQLEAAWDSPEACAWRLGLQPAPPPVLMPGFTAVAADVADFAALIDAGGFDPGAAGFLTLDARPDDTTWLAAMEPSRIGMSGDPSPALRRTGSSTRMLIAGLATRSRLADDGADLARMERFCAMFSHPPTMVDAISLGSFHDACDAAWMEAALRGRLSADQQRAWIGRCASVDLFALEADGWRGERLLVFGAMADLAKRARLDLAVPDHVTGWARPVTAAVIWWHGPQDICRHLDAYAQLEQRLRDGPRQPFDPELAYHPEDGPLLAFHAKNLQEAGITAQEWAAKRRMRRIAVLVAQAVGAGTPVPGDHAALLALLGPDAPLCAAGDDRVALTCQALGPAAFRIVLDRERSSAGLFIPLERYGPPSRRADPTRREPLGPPSAPPSARRLHLPYGLEVWIPARP